MINKIRVGLIAVLLLLLLAPAAFARLTAVGPVVPDADGDPLHAPWAPAFNPLAPTGYNGFPVWYRDSLGQTLTLAPADPVSLADVGPPWVTPFAEQIGFNAEAMFWTCDATMTLGGANRALLVMALECAFSAEDANPGDQITFARIRIRIDTPVPGDYTVFHPYGSKTFLNAPAGPNGINDTSDIGIGAPGDFSGALFGQIGPFLRQVSPAPAPGYIGDLATAVVPGDPGSPGATVINSPIPDPAHPTLFQNYFRVVGPPGSGIDVTTSLFTIGGKIFDGTPYNVTRSTYNRSAAGVFGDVFVTVPPQVPPGTAFRVRRSDQPAESGVSMARNQNQFYARVNFPNGLPPNPTVICTGTTPGTTPTVQTPSLVDAITITRAQATGGLARGLSRYTLTIEAVSSDADAALTAEGWNRGQVAMSPPVAPGNPWTLTVFNLSIPPDTVTVKSTAGKGSESTVTVVLP